MSAAVLRGTVTDPAGRPVAGARVIVSGAGPRALEINTGSDGAFEIANLPAGTHDVRVVRKGLATDPLSVTLTEADVREIAVRMRVSALTESVVLSAAHTDLLLSQAAATVSVITGAEIDARQIRSVGDALTFVPGLSIVRGGLNNFVFAVDPGHPPRTSLYTRGGQADSTLCCSTGCASTNLAATSISRGCRS